MKIVFLDAASLGATSLAKIAELGELITYPTSTPAEALERVAEAEVLIINKVKVTDELMGAAPKLRLICEAATGVNNIDLTAAERRGIPVRNVAGYSTETVVQMTYTLMLNLVCDLQRYDRDVKDLTYSRSGLFTDVKTPVMELDGKTIGIIGMGTIGNRVAEVAQAFGMKVVYFSTSGTSHCTKYPSLPLEELLKVADVVSIHAPLNERTNGLIKAEQLKMMKPTAIIINIGRGGIVSEADLAEAISAGTIAGAGLDVYSKEPLPEDNPLLHTTHPERLKFTPHIGWASREALLRLVEAIANNIKKPF